MERYGSRLHCGALRNAHSLIYARRPFQALVRRLAIAPVADGSVGTPTLFDAMTGKGLGRKRRLISISRIKGDLVWLRYKM